MKLQIDETDKAWTAGIIDGEGCIGIYGNKGRKQIQLTVSVWNTNSKILLRLKEIWAGYIKFAHRPCKPLPSGKQQGQWVVCARKAKKFLETISPYLIGKKEEALLAIEFQKRLNPLNTRKISKEEKEVREKMAKKLKELKRK